MAQEAISKQIVDGVRMDEDERRRGGEWGGSHILRHLSPRIEPDQDVASSEALAQADRIASLVGAQDFDHGMRIGKGAAIPGEIERRGALVIEG